MIIDLSAPFEIQPVPDEWLIERMRLHRDRLLSESDWTILPDTPTNKELWVAYRQSLRDFPQNWEPSNLVNFPDLPEE